MRQPYYQIMPRTGFGETLSPEEKEEFARALTEDIQNNPRLFEMIETMIRDLEGEFAGAFVYSIWNDLVRGIKGESPVLYPRTRRFILEMFQERGISPAGMGSWAGVGTFLLNTALPAVADIGGKIYVSKMQIESQKDIAELKAAQEAEQIKVAKMQAEAKQKEAQAAMLQAVKELKLAESAISQANQPPQEHSFERKKKTDIGSLAIPAAAIAAGALIL